MSQSMDISLQALSHTYPEWKPWLDVVEEVLGEASDPKWEAFIPANAVVRENIPLLAGAEIPLEIDFTRLWVKRLILTASRSGTPNMLTLRRAESAGIDIEFLFQAAMCQHSDPLKEIALNFGIDAGAFQAVAGLVVIPFLQACGRRWAASRSESWIKNYCPICGAWPTFAEIRGIERARCLRCGRCGSEWPVHWLQCPYCDMIDHNQLVSLIPENSGSTRTIEACKRCLGYLKSFTMLQGTPAARVMIEDLASVDLDVAAMEKGYRRAEGSGYSLDVRVISKPVSKRTFFSRSQ
jgi:FdhE protein